MILTLLLWQFYFVQNNFLFWCVLLPIPHFIELVSILCALRLERGGKSCRGVLTLFGKMPGTKFSNSSRGSACCTLSFFTSFVSQKHYSLLQGSYWQQLLLCACPLNTRLSSPHSLWKNAGNEVFKFQLWQRMLHTVILYIFCLTKTFFLNYLLQGSHWQQLLLCA